MIDKLEKRTGTRECVAVEIVPCVMSPALDHHTRSLNDAHAKLRDHGGQLAELKSISAHLVERVTRNEGNTNEQHRILVTLQGGMDAVRSEQGSTARAIESLTRVSQGTHDALMSHVEHSRLRDEEVSAARIKDHEGSTMRSVRLVGVASGIFIVLIALHAFATGQPVWGALLGILKGG